MVWDFNQQFKKLMDKVSFQMSDMQCCPPIAHQQQKYSKSCLLTWESGRGVTLGENEGARSRLQYLALCLPPRSHLSHFIKWEDSFRKISAAGVQSADNRIFRVSHKKTLLALGLQILPLLCQDSSPCLWAKNPEMGHIWLVPTPCFERSHAIQLFVSTLFWI